jgi:transcription elongation factor Elf1
MTENQSKECSDCKELKPLLDFSFRKDSQTYRNSCKICRNLYQKKFSKTEAGKKIQYLADQARKEKFSHKRSARSKTFTAIKNGSITVLPCLICGKKAEAHHPDYSRPLDVMWLCKPHHRETHSLTKGI